MKRSIIIMFAALLMGVSSFAQNTPAAKQTPEQIANERAAAIRKALSLDDKLTKLSYEIELKHAAQMMPANNGVLIYTKQIDAEREAKYKKLFTVEQYSKYVDFLKKQK